MYRQYGISLASISLASSLTSGEAVACMMPLNVKPNGTPKPNCLWGPLVGVTNHGNNYVLTVIHCSRRQSYRQQYIEGDESATHHLFAAMLG